MWRPASSLPFTPLVEGSAGSTPELTASRIQSGWSPGLAKTTGSSPRLAKTTGSRPGLAKTTGSSPGLAKSTGSSPGRTQWSRNRVRRQEVPNADMSPGWSYQANSSPQKTILRFRVGPAAVSSPQEIIQKF